MDRITYCMEVGVGWGEGGSRLFHLLYRGGGEQGKGVSRLSSPTLWQRID